MKLCREGKISLGCFITTVLIAALPEILLRIEFNPYLHDVLQNVWTIHVFQYAFLNILIFLSFQGFLYQITVRSAFLGYVFAIGLIAALFAPYSWKFFGVYLSILATFHYSEFLAISWTNPKEMSVERFILSHSFAYRVAAISSWVEFAVERYYFPGLKEPSFVSYAGLLMCIGGEILRKLAIFTAKHNFNHLVQVKKSENHELVTQGVYKLFRHPSYVGWFYWSLGTQLILQNPICFLGYTITSWYFFYNRITIEEITLLTFFGQEYVRYQKEVGTGLPFISGYTIDS